MSSPTEETLLFPPSSNESSSYPDEGDGGDADVDPDGYGSIYGRGGEDAVANGDAEGDFRKHWHNTTEMIVVLTVIIVIPLAIFVLFVFLAIIRRARHKEQQEQLQRMQQDGLDDDFSREPLRDRGQCTSCLLIEIGEMACYHGVCPNCGRIPAKR